ncbi:RNA polymerase sigma-70 factor, ECF subfamily [Amycolatopsis xylanica]|uniref:RNA polymerase sigma-70 factor, ECF subfamily n=1 Tax=Amycolatopsis xylanica TaxID=589385 RepID=A0A1H2S0Z5_9PSEU|nr:sigma-70 family RNA polymerase sigma factor [Amycolatopsis xylanica]SDW24764.1 RNA polymerase sigma-70 factor, ECF subfamily [Amycolatopsis xylanica]
MTAPPDAKAESPPDAFEVVFDRHFAEIHGYVARRLGVDIADDVASETFLVAYRTRDRFDPARGDHRAWLYGIASNLMRRHRRSEIRGYRALTRLDASSAVLGHEDAAIARVSAQDLREPLARALAGLSAGDRDVLLLIALAELTYDQVAAALGISYGTVCSRLSRARRKVRTSLESQS